MKIVRWTFWKDPEYPEADWDPNDENNPYVLSIIDAIRNPGCRFDGYGHQYNRYGVLVFDDGKQYAASMREWGYIMAKALGIEGDDAYLIWAWDPPEEEQLVFPDPSEWNEIPEESAKQEERLERHADEWISP